MDSAPPPDRVVGGEDSAVVDEEEGEREGEDSAIAEADDDVTGGRVVYTASDYEDGDRLDHAAADDQGVDSGAEFHSSSPAPVSDSNEGSRIRREAFTPGYFKRFFVTERELGRGGKGVVLLVRHEISNCPLGLFACKRVPVGDDHKWLEKGTFEPSERFGALGIASADSDGSLVHSTCRGHIAG